MAVLGSDRSQTLTLGRPSPAGGSTPDGARYDLWQISANGSWHHELRPGASTDGCPEVYPEAAHDPRSRN